MRPDVSFMPKHAPLVVSAVLCLLWLGVLAANMWNGLTFLSFFDEATHILGGRMLDSGAILYRDFVDSHGPFIFFLTQIYGLVAGWSNPNTARVINVLFVVCSIISVATSPALGSTTTRISAVAVFAGLMSGVWLRQGLFMVSFYPIAGALAGISLSSLVLPAAPDAKASCVHAVAAGLALAMLGAVAYSFAPTILLFSAIVIWNSHSSRGQYSTGWFFFGEAVGAVLLLIYLCMFADLRGYLSFHIAESQFIYAKYIRFSFGSFVQSLRLSASPDDRVQGLTVWCAAGSVIVLGTLAVRRHQLPRLLSLFGILAGVLALNARGAVGFQDGAFLYAVIVLASISSASLLETIPRRFYAGAAVFVSLLIAGMAAAVKPAPYTPSEMSHAVIKHTPRWPIGGASNGLFFQHIREFAKPGERILALAYQPNLYLLADRLPMNGFYAYFPWDADYAKAPWFNRPRDVCLALKRTPPPVIVYNDYPIWGYAPASYIPCLLPLLKADYVEDARLQDVHGRLFVRRDRASSIGRSSTSTRH